MGSEGEGVDVVEGGVKALVPEQRFPEFRDAEAWRLGTLKEFATFSSGGTPFKDKPEYWNGIIPWISASSMHYLVINKADHYVTHLAIGNGTRIAKRGAILILVRGSMLFKRVPICIAEIDVAFNQDVKALNVNASLNKYFLLYYLVAFQKQFQINETGIGAGKIELDQLKNFILSIPTRPEQKKIADCLASIDDLIAAQAEKVEALKAHKKGLMQRLFPRPERTENGQIIPPETKPRLRFPEFEGAGDWAEVSLGKMGTLVPGLTYSPDDVRDAGLLVLRSSNVQNSKIALNDCVFVDLNVKGASLSQPNDILICVRNGSKALIGKSALIPEGMPISTHGAFMTVFRSPAPRFVFQLFQTAEYQKQVDGDLGATINSINGSQFVRYKFMTPKPKEQQRIADCLTDLDDLITAQVQKLDLLKTHKKGLMQQLFPQAEEAFA